MYYTARPRQTRFFGVIIDRSWGFKANACNVAWRLFCWAIVAMLAFIAACVGVMIFTAMASLVYDAIDHAAQYAPFYRGY